MLLSLNDIRVYLDIVKMLFCNFQSFLYEILNLPVKPLIFENIFKRYEIRRKENLFFRLLPDVLDVRVLIPYLHDFLVFIVFQCNDDFIDEMSKMITFDVALRLIGIDYVVHENRFDFYLLRILKEKSTDLFFPVLSIGIIDQLIENGSRLQSFDCFVKNPLKQGKLLLLKPFVLKFFDVIVLCDDCVKYVEKALQIEVNWSISWKVKIVFNDFENDGILGELGLNNQRSLQEILEISVCPELRN